MTRIVDDFALGNGPIENCYWNETASAPSRPNAEGDKETDVAIIGSGFTGLSAALRLAQSGGSTIVVDANQPGWGASGRNGGFCCLGGAKASDATLRQRFGSEAVLDYHHAERDAVELVANLLDQHNIDADTHSRGETLLAHRPRDTRKFEAHARWVQDTFGVEAKVIQGTDLSGHGLNGAFHGALTIPIGFALNPRKYVLGLAEAAERAGARIFGDTPVQSIERRKDSYLLRTPDAVIRARKIIVATNGYSSETVPDWMRGRYLPVQSNVIVTRPITEEEQARQGWYSQQMSYDTRKLLHYFRLMPDGRFLFGMRGGLRTSQSGLRSTYAAIRRHFETMFPDWAHIETPWFWNGFVCMSPDLSPFVGAVPGDPNIVAAYAYHGNGVAMGTYCGALAADQVMEEDRLRKPEVIATPPGRFPGGRYRRLALWPAYLGYLIRDF